MNINPIRGQIHEQHLPTFWGKVSKFQLSLFTQSQLELSFLDHARDRKGFWGWLRSFFYKPITIHDNTQNQDRKVYVNVRELSSKLTEFGLNPDKVKKAIQQDNLGELLLDYKADVIVELFPENLVTRSDVQAALNWISKIDLKHMPSQFSISNNPIIVIKNDDKISLKVGEYEVGLDEISLHVKTQQLERYISKPVVSRVNSYFKKHMHEIVKSQAKKSEPLVFYASKSGISKTETLSSHKIIVLSPHDIMIDTGKELGKGTYKTVRKVQNLFTGKEFAYYTFSYDVNKPISIDTQMSLREIEDLTKFSSSKGILKIHKQAQHISKSQRKHEVVTKLYNKGSLRNLVENQMTNVSQQLAVLKQISEGLAALHLQGKIHKDLKPENVLVEEVQGELKAVISDIGALSDERDVDKTEFLTTTRFYRPPEFEIALIRYKKAKEDQAYLQSGKILSTPSLIRKNEKELKEAFEKINKTVSQKYDVWSLGIIFYELTQGKLPFGLHQNMTERSYEYVMSHLPPLVFSQKHILNPLIKKMLAAVDQRITIQEIINNINQII